LFAVLLVVRANAFTGAESLFHSLVLGTVREQRTYWLPSEGNMGAVSFAAICTSNAFRSVVTSLKKKKNEVSLTIVNMPYARCHSHLINDPRRAFDHYEIIQKPFNSTPPRNKGGKTHHPQ
jgi:hypothetical protein